MVLFNSLTMVSENAAKPSVKWVAGIKSQVSPWLATLAYPLGCGVVILGTNASIPMGCFTDPLRSRTSRHWARFAIYGVSK